MAETNEPVTKRKEPLGKHDRLTEDDALDLLDVMTPGDAILTLWRDMQLHLAIAQQEIERLKSKLITTTDMLQMAVIEADAADEIEARLMEEIGESYQE